MIDSELSTDLRRPCTPSRGPASAVLAHPLTNGLAPVLGASPRSGPPGQRIPRRQSESIIRVTNPSNPEAGSQTEDDNPLRNLASAKRGPHQSFPCLRR